MQVSPEVEKARKEALKSGSGKARFTLILMHGAPQAGKTSVKLVLEGKPPQKKQNSTGIMEIPARLIATSRFVATGTKEKDIVIETVNEQKLIEMIAAHVHQLKKHQSNQVFNTAYHDSHKESANIVTSLSSETSEHHLVKLVQSHGISNDKQHDNYNETANIGTPTSTTSPKEGQVIADDTQVNTSQTEMAGVIHDVLNELEGTTIDSTDLFDVHWIHIVDSGGQPQFSDVIRLMYQSASLHIVVIRLDKTLKEKTKVEYMEDGENKYRFSENLSLSSLQIIERTCQLANSDPKRPQWVMIVATRLDQKLLEESLEEKNKQLENVYQKYINNIIRASDKSIIFAMNAVTDEVDKLENYKCHLQKQILKAPKLSYEEVPVKWMLFDLEVQRRTAEEDILQKSVCKEAAKSCYLNQKDMEYALQYFTEVGLHMHHSVVPDLVFISVTPVVERLTNTISASFRLPEHGPMDEDRCQLRAGKLTTKLLDKLWSSNQKFNKSVFTAEKFLALLEHFHIAVKMNENTYFLPCVLPLDDPTNKVEPYFKKNCDPIILLMENDNILPQGFFPALTIHLLQRRSSPAFELNIKNKQFRRVITLISTDTCCGVCLVDQISWFDIYLSGDVKHCPDVLKAVEESVKHICRHLKVAYQLKRGFDCPHDCGIEDDHPCVLTENGAKCLWKLHCCYTNEELISDKRECWLNSSTGL